MTLPVGITTCQLTFGQALQFDGAPARMTVRVTPTHNVVYAPTGQPLVNFPFRYESDPTTGRGVIVVPVCDQGDFIDLAGDPFLLWSYTIEISYAVDGSVKPIVVRKAVQPLTGDTVIDIDTLVAGEVAPSESVTSPRPPTLIPLVFSVPGLLIAGQGQAPWPVVQNYAIHSTRAVVPAGKEPDGAEIVVDINVNGTTIFGDQSKRPTIMEGAQVGVGGAPTVTTIAAGSLLTVDVDAVGTVDSGSDLGVFVYVYQP